MVSLAKSFNLAKHYTEEVVAEGIFHDEFLHGYQ